MLALELGYQNIKHPPQSTVERERERVHSCVSHIKPNFHSTDKDSRLKMNNLKYNMIENRIDEQKDQNKTVIDLCSSSSEDDRSNTNDDDDSDDDSDDDDSNHVPLQEECHPSNDECNSPPLLKGPIHRMNDLEDQNVNRTINERMTSSSASSSANSSENHTQCKSSPTAQRIGLIRSVKSASFSTTSKQTSSNPSKSCATLKPLQHEKNTNVTSTTTTSTSTSTSSSTTTSTSSSATTAATTTTSSSVLNKEDDSITMEQIESNMQDLCIEYCWSCDSKIYPTHGDLICEHPLLGYVYCTPCTVFLTSTIIVLNHHRSQSSFFSILSIHIVSHRVPYVPTRHTWSKMKRNSY